MNKKDYPLVILKNTSTLFKSIRVIVNEYRDIITITEDENLSLIIEDIGKGSSFYFKVENPKMKDKDFLFTTTFKPSSAISTNSATHEFKADKVLSYLRMWALSIIEYEAIELTIKDKIIHQYEEEFFHDFEIIDEDSDTEAFNLNHQVLIDNFLNKTILILEQHNKEDTQELIQEAIEVKNQITRLNKKQFIKILGNMIAKIRIKGLPILKQVIEIAGKEVIKRLTNSGLDNLGI